MVTPHDLGIVILFVIVQLFGETFHRGALLLEVCLLDQFLLHSHAHVGDVGRFLPRWAHDLDERLVGAGIDSFIYAAATFAGVEAPLLSHTFKRSIHSSTWCRTKSGISDRLFV